MRPDIYSPNPDNSANLGFSGEAAEIIYNWRTCYASSFNDLVGSERRFLDIVPHTSYSNSMSQARISLVPEPNAYAKALDIQEELNDALMQLK